jgi:hypothetical protein
MLVTAGLGIVVLAIAGAEPASGAARRLLEQERCQVELPIAGKTGTPESAARMAGSVRPESGVVPALVPALPASVVSAVVVAILVAAGLAVLLHRLPATDPVPPAEAAPPRRKRKESAPERQAPASLDAERLAAEGRFAEAIHALLLRGLAKSASAAARPALTSREVLRDLRLPGEARQALEALVRSVEWAHFGGRPVGAAEYEASLAEYRRLREAWPR